MSSKNTKLRKAEKQVAKGKVDSKSVDWVALCPAFSKQDLSDGQCKACSKKAKTKALFVACSAASLAAKTATVSKSKVKKSSEVDPFGSRINTNKHAFAELLYNSANGITMKQVKQIMNPVNDGSRQPTFYCFTAKLSADGFVKIADKVISLTDKGRSAWAAYVEKKAA